MTKPVSVETFKSFIPFFMRMGEVVARAIALTTDVRRPVKLLHQGEVMSDGRGSAEFKFEGGLVVKLSMFNMGALIEPWRSPHEEYWVVYEANIRFYANQEDKEAQRKTSQTWDADRLRQLRDLTGFRQPGICSIDDIKGTIGIFVNWREEIYRIETDPDESQFGNYLLAESLEYRVLVEGDKERVRKQADKRGNDLINASSSMR